jgi:hypothetical protein
VKNGVVTGLVLNVPRRAASTLPRSRRAAAQAATNCNPGKGRKPMKNPAKTPRATRCGWSGNRRIR